MDSCRKALTSKEGQRCTYTHTSTGVFALPCSGTEHGLQPLVAGAAVELRFEGSEELGDDPLGTPPKGEICLRGPIIFQGYYQDKKKTDEAFGK